MASRSPSMSKAKDTDSVQKDVGVKRNPVTKWVLRITFVLALIATCNWLDTIKDRWYVFEPTKLHQLAQSAIAAHQNDTAGMIRHIVTNLTAEYSPSVVAINPDASEWFFNNAGGAMGALYIIHASITEYLIIFGTPLGTEGHTGVLSADDYFNILVGEQWAFSPGQLEMERYPAGSVHYLPRGTPKQYKMHKGCFALEYARGWIPLMLPFGFTDGFTSTLDIVALYRMTILSAREMFRNLLIGKI
ncbi:C-8 sterol isomerase [Stygiomarasmius scandens]|uniref:C-8 sterol isomerase n=1 Tax=Marasmiellus scandens TaxID=2682957 RepID=A0ABR1K2N7_9AGAR